MQGKIIVQNLQVGFIEYDLDKRISYNLEEYPDFQIGDSVLFELEYRKLSYSEFEVEYAINLQLIAARVHIEGKFLRLGKLAAKYNCPILLIQEILVSNGFDIDGNPNSKIFEEQLLIVENHFTKELTLSETSNNLIIERGTVINSTVVEIIYPSLVVMAFFNNQKAILPLSNLSWNKSRSEKILNTLKKGDTLEVVVLELEDRRYPVLSRKHLISRPNETTQWEELQIGQIVKGFVFESLVNDSIIELENGFFGKIKHHPDLKLRNGKTLSFSITGKDQFNFYIGLSEPTENEINIQKPVVGKIDLNLLNSKIQEKNSNNKIKDVHSSYPAHEVELRDHISFQDSLYYNFCDDEQADFLDKAFTKNPYLFAGSISLPKPLLIKFDFNLTAWESDFKNKLIPYLSSENESISENDALKLLSEQKYWIRINRIIKDNRENTKWIVFNEEFMLIGFVEDQTCAFKVLSIDIQRSKKEKSYQKTKSIEDGTFLLESKIEMLSPHQSKLSNADQIVAFELLDEKTKSHEIIKSLKQDTGALLLEEGQSLHIFDRFLEYQEDQLKKGNTANRIWIKGNFNRINSNNGALCILIKENLDDFCPDDTVSSIVTIRTIEKSTKENREEEFVFFCDARLEVIPNGSKLHFEDDVLLSKLEKGFFVEPKISTRQFQVQREVLQDFFSKKIKLQHIESLLLKPEKIEPPKKETIKFFNEMLGITEKLNPENNQVNSVKKSVGNKNIFLIQGPPGTGKTTVIAEIVQQLTARNERILVTSQTHIAVDNVLEKLSSVTNLSLLRLGNQERVKPELRKYHKDNLIEVYKKHFSEVIKVNTALSLKFIQSDFELSNLELMYIAETDSIYPDSVRNELLHYNLNFINSLVLLEKEKILNLPKILLEWSEKISSEQSTLILPLMYNSLDVAFATCIATRTERDLIDYNVQFDTVIIDEAGKANLSESIAAISMAKRVILVGDQMQLPPYIDGSLLDPNEKNSFPNSKFGNKFLDVDVQHALRTSFFEFIVNRKKANLFPDTNIEMLNYQHRMHPDIGQFVSDAFYNGKVKMGEKTSENVLKMPAPFDKQIVFLDTSTAQNPFETKQGISVKNDTEALCISQLIVPKLIENGLSPKDCAIVAPYKSQVTNIRACLNNLDSVLANQINVSTLDSFQGMEFDVIIFSFTRSAPSTKVGFLDDARRLNVAFSRARKKLILIGNSETLTDSRSHYDLLFNYTGLFKNLVRLSKNDHLGNFVNVTDFTDIKTRFQANIHLLKENLEYDCKLKLTFEKPDFLGHIFYIENTGMEGLLYDKNKSFEFDSEMIYKLFVTNIDSDKERISLSIQSKTNNNKSTIVSKNLKPLFFQKHKVGDLINVRYTNSIDYGHFFEIESGFNCFLHDKNKDLNFLAGNYYDLWISKMDIHQQRIGVEKNEPRKVSNFKSVNRKPTIEERIQALKSFNVGDEIQVKFKNSTLFGHFFELTPCLDGLVFGNTKKQTNFIKGQKYLVRVNEIDTKNGKVSLTLISN